MAKKLSTESILSNLSELTIDEQILLHNQIKETVSTNIKELQQKLDDESNHRQSQYDRINGTN